MGDKLEIDYPKLLKLIRQLTPAQRRRLLKALQQEEKPAAPAPNDLQKLLLTGPVWSEEECQNVLKTHAQLDQLGQQHGAR